MADLDASQRLLGWLKADAYRMQALAVLAQLPLADALIAAGFVRNLVWDHLHGYQSPTPLQDLDVIYFDRSDCGVARDRQLEAQLQALWPAPWSVKNQARMHRRNGDAPYQSSADAMRYWPEVETAVGARLADNGEPLLVAPLGLDSLFAGDITLNPNRPKPVDFQQRLNAKGWLTTWPKLRLG